MPGLDWMVDLNLCIIQFKCRIAPISSVWVMISATAMTARMMRIIFRV